MSEQQKRPAGDGGSEGDVRQASEETFDASAAEMETDSGIAEGSAEDLVDLLEKARWPVVYAMGTIAAFWTIERILAIFE